ncbi:hypothetical protein QLS71_015880 [Mariniflexile litorale]|uniref:SnoaL-like domain-containing protein n=1 Tax=Mariniflexile litorale TaxID=3045158 RepID=A0AAU7EEL7_9FLAO|nr:hypothetical protein [Mariniflexile sp. KMM 9835]MDQ8212376.1 hypothetical protein [Mariniflexile sp. KMM 9835]
MKKPTILKLVMAVTLLSFFTGFAQEKQVSTLLKSYIQASNQLGVTKDVNNILSLFDSSYKNNIAYVGLTGVVNKSTVDFDQFSNQLSENLKNHNYNFTMSVGEIIYESQKKRAGTISALINFESKIEGKIAEKGTILMNLVTALVKDEWKIILNNTVRVSEASEIGNCVCYLFSKGESFFNAETYYPAGVEYNKEYKSFRVSIKEGKRTIINKSKDDKAFDWTENGDVLDNGVIIGNAETSDKAVQIVLSHVYGETCTKINFS